MSCRSRFMHSDQIETSEIRRFEEQYAENPDSFVFARLADAHRKAGHSERALEILRQGLQRHPDYLSAHIVHARCLLELGRDAEAIAAWRQVLELDPQNLVALRQLAELALAAGDRAVARTWAERLLLVDPLNEEAARLVADTAPKGQPTAESQPGEAVRAAEGEASELVDRASAKDSQEDAVTFEVGMITETMADLYVQQGLYEEAAEIYWELVKRRPAEPRLRERLAQAQALASGEARTESTPSVVPLERWTPDARPEASEPAPAASREHEPTDSAGREPATGEGIRAHLRALIEGQAAVEGPDAEHGEEEASEAGEETDGRDSTGEGKPASGFGAWLRNRKR